MGNVLKPGFKKKVIAFIRSGNSVTQATSMFQIARATIYHQLNRLSLESVESRRRKIDVAKNCIQIKP